MGETRELVERLSADPRVTVLHRGFNGVFQIRPATGFVLDWNGYPRLTDPAARAVEGYVDARRITQDRDCSTLVHEEQVQTAARVDYEARLRPHHPLARRPPPGLDGGGARGGPG